MLAFIGPCKEGYLEAQVKARNLLCYLGDILTMNLVKIQFYILVRANVILAQVHLLKIKS